MGWLAFSGGQGMLTGYVRYEARSVGNLHAEQVSQQFTASFQPGMPRREKLRRSEPCKTIDSTRIDSSDSDQPLPVCFCTAGYAPARRG